MKSSNLICEGKRRKGENAGYQYFLLFPTMFSKGLPLKVVKSRDCVVNTSIHLVSSFKAITCFHNNAREAFDKH